MILDLLPLTQTTARLIRVYGEDPCITLPTEARTPEGVRYTITELGDYCFSENLRNPPAAPLCRCTTDGGPVPEEAMLHPVCGNFLEEAALPEGLRVIGSCAFYNCRKLRRLSVGAGELTMGSDVFLNCFALADLIVRADPDQPTGLFALVNNITEAVRALFWLPAEATPRAGLWYPAYWEDVEESPAHILLHTFSGQGYHYRQCFLDNKFLCAEYDAIFPEGHASEDRDIMAMLCFDRLRWPWNLTGKAKAAYTGYLKANTGRVVARLLKAQDVDGLRQLLALDVMDAPAFAAAAQLAAKADNAAAAALLADAEYQKRGAAPKKKRYDFDF